MSSLDRTRASEKLQRLARDAAQRAADCPPGAAESHQDRSGAAGTDEDHQEPQAPARDLSQLGRDWDAGPELTEAQRARNAIAERDAAVRADMRRDELGAIGPDGRWHWARDWREV